MYEAPRATAATAAFAAEQPPAGGPYGDQPPYGGSAPKDPFASQAAPGQNPSDQSPSGQNPSGSSDPFAPPAQPGSPYVVTPHGQPGHGGPGGSGPVWGTPVPMPPDDGRKRRGFGSLVAAVIVAALVAGGIGGGIGYAAARHDNNNDGSTTVSSTANQKALNRAPTSVAGIAKNALPSVVTIKATGSQESGTGTGFVYDKQGHILTNNHVVAPAADGGKLTATFSNGKTYDAEVVGRAQGYDVAVIKLKNAGGQQLDPLPLGNSDESAVGDATIAIGAPYGLSGTVTTGIVSAVHRPVASSDGQGTSVSYMSAIQTDASINPGNSGGPLLNANGAVIGIDSAIQPTGNSDSGSQPGSVGLGFAIPINQAKRVADQLIKSGQPIYPVMLVTLDTSYEGTGAKVSDSQDAVTAGGPGAKAGLRSGDIITKFDDTMIDSGQTLIAEIWQHSPNDKATITYTRSGATHTTTLTLGSRTGDSTN
jgi:putative serine protease PepD